MRTTLDIPDSLFREVKTLSVQKGVKLKDLLAQFIEAGLHNPDLSSKSVRAKCPSPIPIAIPRKPGTRKTPAMTNAKLHAILHAEDTTQFNHLHGR